MLTPREKSPLPKKFPEEDRTRDAVDSEPKHYQLSYSGPQWWLYLQVVGVQQQQKAERTGRGSSKDAGV